MTDKQGLHPRNRHRGRYDFDQLIQTCPDLAQFVSVNKYQEQSIDYARPEAVKTLNQALLKLFYGISNWNIPAQYLCPPIPGRADYLHYLADLLGSCNGGVAPRGRDVRVLDIGVGANCVYPLIGHCEYGWRFVGSDIDPMALTSAQRNIEANDLQGEIELRKQSSAKGIFSHILQTRELFDASLCNPPFHESQQEAQKGTRRKWSNLNKGNFRNQTPLLNFGGHSTELWCEGGEAGFVGRMIEESAKMPDQVFWFSTLISKESNLRRIYGLLNRVKVVEKRTIPMTQGQKKSRIVAWTFLNESRQKEWRLARWGNSRPAIRPTNLSSKT